jgi:hypothetical protein
VDDKLTGTRDLRDELTARKRRLCEREAEMDVPADVPIQDEPPGRMPDPCS